MNSIRTFYTHYVTPTTGGSPLPGAILSTDSLLALSGSALAARVFAGTDRGARAVRWLQTHTAWARHVFPFAETLPIKADDSPALQWGKHILNGTVMLIRGVVVFQGGALIGPATLIAGTHVYLGLAGLSAGANAGVLDHDVRAIKARGTEAVIRERLVAGTDDCTMQQWISAIASRLARTSFRARKSCAVEQQRKALQETMDRITSDITAEQLRADIAAQMAAIHQFVDAHQAEMQGRAKGIIDKARDIAQGPASARTRERLEVFLTELKRPESLRRHTPSARHNGSRTAPRPATVTATTTAPDPARSSRSTTRPTDKAVVRLLRKPPATLEFADWARVCNGHLHTSDPAFFSVARFYQTHAALRAAVLRAASQPPQEGNSHWEPLPDAAPGIYRYRLGASHQLIGRQEPDQFVITGVEG